MANRFSGVIPGLSRPSASCLLLRTFPHAEKVAGGGRECPRQPPHQGALRSALLHLRRGDARRRYNGLIGMRQRPPRRFNFLWVRRKVDRQWARTVALLAYGKRGVGCRGVEHAAQSASTIAAPPRASRNRLHDRWCRRPTEVPHRHAGGFGHRRPRPVGFGCLDLRNEKSRLVIMHNDFHENYGRGQPKPPSERSTGTMFAVVGVIIAVIWRHNAVTPWVALAAASVFAALSTFAASLLLHRIGNPVVMFAMFALVFVPAGFIMRIWSDPLRSRRITENSSYWIERPRAGTGSMRNQF
jgi:hypothetical protein